MIASETFAQIKVDRVKFTETVDNSYVSWLPRLTDEGNPNNMIVKKINSFILDRFMIESFDQQEIEEFRWYEVDFTQEMREDILYIHFAGEYYGAYPNYITEDLYFSLKTGEILNNANIPFHSLFTLDGYLDFLHRFWMAKVKIAFQEAIECAESEPYCSYYDIYSYGVDNDKLNFALVEDCYPRVSRACAPYVSATLPLDSVISYLSDEGKKILLTDSYTSKRGIDRFLYNRSAPRTVKNNAFLFGKIDGKYPFSMAIHFEFGKNQIDGYYFYDRKLEKLKLAGSLQGNSLILDEFLDEHRTGSFTLNISDKYVKGGFPVYTPDDKSFYISGTWSNPDKSKTFKIEFSEAKFSSLN
ncbi:hypothetical protein [uncultured Imperialibacter sp.]|uniref:hypothetical protein n=1 Tax=uncultured Imperialibacter sp. TaxID=1672639 RepID=UPI0030DA8928